MLLSVSVDFKDKDDEEEEEDGEVDASKRIRSFRGAKNLDDGDGNRSIHPLANKGNKMMHSRRKLMKRFILIVHGNADVTVVLVYDQSNTNPWRSCKKDSMAARTKRCQKDTRK